MYKRKTIFNQYDYTMSTLTSKRTVSCLKKLKTYFRNIMAEVKINNLNVFVKLVRKSILYLIIYF